MEPHRPLPTHLQRFKIRLCLLVLCLDTCELFFLQLPLFLNLHVYNEVAIILCACFQYIPFTYSQPYIPVDMEYSMCTCTTR